MLKECSKIFNKMFQGLMNLNSVEMNCNKLSSSKVVREDVSLSKSVELIAPMRCTEQNVLLSVLSKDCPDLKDKKRFRNSKNLIRA